MAKRKSRSGGSSDGWRDATQRILESLDLGAEYAALGIAITGNKPNRGGWLECHAVGGEPDETPSAAINVAGGHPLLGRYKDSRGGNNCQPQTRTLSLFDFAAMFGSFANWKQARQHYADKTGVKLPADDPDKPEDRRPADRIDQTDWCEPLAALWLETERARGISLDALLAAGAILAKWPAGSSNPALCVGVPAYGQHFTECDPTGYVLWNQNGRTLPLYRGKDKPVESKKMLAIGNGWIVLGNLQTAEIVWKTEGPTDLLALWTAALADLDGLADIASGKFAAFTNACGASEYPDPQLIAHLAGKSVYLVHDADTPGQLGAIEKWLPAIAAVARETRHVQLPYDIQPDHGKDVRDYLHDDGHAYHELMELGAGGELFSPSSKLSPTANAGSGSTADGNSIPTSTMVARESDDDPHRLARVNLTRYAAATAGIATIRFWRNEFYTWKGKAYRKIDDEEFRAKVAGSIKAEFDRLNILARESASTVDPGESKKVTSHLVNNVIKATASMTLIPSHVEQMTWLQPDPEAAGRLTRERRNYIAVQNGILDIDAFLANEDEPLMPHSPNWFSTICLPYEFKPDAYPETRPDLGIECQCPRWQRFLERNLELDPERIKILQEWAGYLLLPDTGQQKFLMLEGEGANGKSVYLAAITAMLGEANCSHVSLETFGQRFDRTQTLGKLANIAADVGELDKVAEGYLKSFTSGDVMFFDRKGITGLDTAPTARLMLACNNRPRFSDRSQGIWRRMLLVPWKVEIPERERVPNMDKPWFWERSGELPAILNWALIGLDRLREQGRFTTSEESRRAMADYQDESNPAAAFLKEHVEQSKDGHIRCKELYGLYTIWTESNGNRPLGERQFGKEVSRYFKHTFRQRGDETVVRKGENRRVRYWFYRGLQFTVDEICGQKTNDHELF